MKASEAASSATEQGVREQAEQYLQSVQHADNVLHVCNDVLERSGSPLAEFHAARIMCTACLEKWDAVDAAARSQLREYLFRYGVSRANALTLPVRNKVLQAHAILWKRGWLEMTQADADEFLGRVEQSLSSSADNATSVTLVQTLTSLVQEFSSAKSSSVGLTLEWHRKSAEAFQARGLQRIMRIALAYISTLLKSFDHGASIVPVLVPALALLVETLSWEFLRSGQAGSDYMTKQRRASMSSASTATTNERADEETAPVVPVAAFRDLFLFSELKTVMLHVYTAVRFHSEELRTLATQSLLLLASVRGDEVFHNHAERVQYLSACLIPVLQSAVVPPNGAILSEEEAGDAIAVCRILSQLVASFGTVILVQVPNVIEALRHASDYSIQMLQSAVKVTVQNATEFQELPDPQEPTMAAFNFLLSMWVSVIMDSQAWDTITNTFPDGARMLQAIKQFTFPLFQAALCGRMEIAKCLVSVGLDDDDEFEDVSALNAQMQDLGILARTNVDAALSTMRHAMVDTASRLRTTASGGRTDMSCVLEEMWWVCHFLGHILTDDDEMEGSNVPLIPRAVLDAAFAGFVGTANGGGTFELMGLTEDMFAIVEFECTRIMNALGASGSGGGGVAAASSLSPLLAEKLLWLTRRWARSYLMPDASMYDVNHGVSPNLLAAYGAESSTAHSLVNFLVSKACMFLAFWGYEEGVCREACQLLKNLAFRHTTRKSLLQQDAFLVLVRSFSTAVAEGRRSKTANVSEGGDVAIFSQGLKNLPDQYAEELVFFICRACDGFDDASAQLANFSQAVNPILTRFQYLVGPQDFVAISSQRPAVSLEILRLLGMFCGIAKSTTTQNHNTVFSCLSTLLPSIVQLIHVYRTHDLILKNILRFFALLAESQVQVLSPSQSLSLCQACSMLFQTYAEHNLARKWTKVANKALSEEEQEEMSAQIIAFLNILTHLASKGIIDFFDYDAAQDEATAQMAVSVVSDAIVFGMKMAIPLIGPELLQFSKLRESYFDLVTHVVESYPEKVATLDEPLFASFMQSLEFGARHFDSTIVRSTLSAIEEFATFVAKSRGLVVGARTLPQFIGSTSDQLATNCQRHFLRLMFELVLYQTFLSDHIDCYGSAILALTISESKAFMDIAGQVLEAEPDSATKQRLTGSFETLVQSNGVVMNRLDRSNRIKFRKNFRQFVGDVRGIVKKQ